MLSGLAKDNREELVQRAVDLYHQGLKPASIARELDIPGTTIRRWLKDKAGRKPKDVRSKDYVEETLTKHDTHIEEKNTIEQIADAQATPAEPYQAFMAGLSLKKLKDADKLGTLGPIRTARDAEIWNKIARENLGLSGQSGGGPSGKIQIDLSILREDWKKKGKIIDAEESEPEDKK